MNSKVSALFGFLHPRRLTVTDMQPENSPVEDLVVLALHVNLPEGT